LKISVILAHPDIKSFNYAIAETALATLKKNGHDVIFHDLYREKFPPVLPAEEISREAALPRVIARHCAEIAAAEGIVIIHPNWWGQPPAILKGWIDRVLRPGVAYKFAEGDSIGAGELIGLLKAEAVLVFNTSNTTEERENAIFGDPLETLWKNNMLISCGAKSYFRRTFQVIVASDLKQRQSWLKEIKEITGRYFPAEMS
jgi:NAD(P)H dehydrogenase (quinone)